MRTKEPPKGGAEHDVLSGWRRVLCWTQRAGACSFYKRQNRRRQRHKMNKDMNEEVRNDQD